MHLIWKRPDGFQNALPEDFRKISLSSGAQLWLHKQDVNWYPFQVSGDWEGEEQTKRLNKLVNMLDTEQSKWTTYLQHILDNEFSDTIESKSLSEVANTLVEWIKTLEKSFKGQKWEIEIIQCALNDVYEKLRFYIK